MHQARCTIVVVALLWSALAMNGASAEGTPTCDTVKSESRPRASVEPAMLPPNSVHLQCGPWNHGSLLAGAQESAVSQASSQQGLKWIAGLTNLLAVLAWPLVVLLIAFWFRDQIIGLLERIKQVNMGSAELFFNELNAAPIQKQRENLAREAKETADNEPTPVATPADAATPISSSKRHIERNPLLAEDLALRAIQDEYGSTIRRQVMAPEGPVFDGVFVNDGRIYIVEVKYYRQTFLASRLRNSLDSLSRFIRGRGWRQARILLVAVFDERDDLSTARRLLSRVASSSEVPVIVRTFTLDELKAKFDTSESDD